MRNFCLHTLLGCTLLSGAFVGPVSALAQDEPTQTGYGRRIELISASEDKVWTKHFRVGALVGFNLKAEFSTSGTFAFTGNDPGATGVRGVNHEYDNGFVRVDATDNDVNSTYYWSYNDASQYDGANNRLYFNNATDYSTGDSGSATADPQVGVDIAYGAHLYRVGSVLVGWEFGYGYMPISIENNLSGTATVNQNAQWYDTSNLGSAFFIQPNGSTLGSYTGTEAGPGAKLNDLATSAGTTNSVAAIDSTTTLDVNLHNFRLGPTVYWELTPKFAMAVSGGGAMGIVSGELQFNDTINLGNGSAPNNSGSFSDTQLIYGGYLAGKLIYHAVENGDFYIGVQYMPLSSATFSGGGREAKLDMSGGLYVSAGVNWPF